MDLSVVGVAGFLCLILLVCSGGVLMVVDSVAALVGRGKDGRTV